MRLYVGNLPFSYTEEEFKKLFAKYAPSSVRLIKDNDTGRCKGYGFVDLTDEQAQEAIKELNGKEEKGKNLIVNEARPQEKRDFNHSSFGNRPPRRR